jgi:hypothetical protein
LMNYNNIWKGQLEEVLVGGVYVDVWYFPNCVRVGAAKSGCLFWSEWLIRPEALMEEGETTVYSTVYTGWPLPPGYIILRMSPTPVNLWCPCFGISRMSPLLLTIEMTPIPGDTLNLFYSILFYTLYRISSNPAAKFIVPFRGIKSAMA